VVEVDVAGSAECGEPEAKAGDVQSGTAESTPAPLAGSKEESERS
jgi:hypothetical protein